MISHRPLKIPFTVVRLVLGLTALSATGQAQFSGLVFSQSSLLGSTPISTYPNPPSTDGSTPGSTRDSISWAGDDGLAGSASYSSASGWFGLSVSASSDAACSEIAPFCGSWNTHATSRAALQVSDLVFSGPAPQVSAGLNILYSTEQTTSPDSFGEASFAASLNDFSQIGGTSQNGSFERGLIALELTFLVETGIPVGLAIELDVTALAIPTHPPLNTGMARSKAYLSLPTGVPLFNLPEGFTVNSASLHVVNNRYSPPTAAGDTKVTSAIADDQLTLTWTATAGKTYTAQRAATPTGPYETVAIGLTSGTYTENVGDAVGRYYRVISE